MPWSHNRKRKLKERIEDVIVFLFVIGFLAVIVYFGAVDSGIGG